MIKGDYFGKLLKPLFSILLIGFFGLSVNSFANGAGAYTTVGLTSSPSAVNSSYDITFLKGGGLLTNYIGQGRGILALDQNILFWWLPDGLPYFYGPRFQGYFSFYSYCSSLVSGGNYQQPTDCNRQSLDENSKVYLKNFFSTIKAGDIVYYSYSDEGWPNWWAGFSVCFDSSDIGHSMCFGTTYNYNGNYDNTALVNSRGYNNLTFANLSNSDIGKAPGQNGYGGIYDGSTEGSNQGTIDSTYTGDYTYTECTNGSIMNYAEKMGISPYMCQGGLDNWDLLSATGNYNPIPGSGYFVDEIFGQTRESSQSAKDWFNYRNTAYINQYVSNQNIWYNQPAVLRSYFKIYNEYGGNNFDFDTIYEYCLMRKFYTWDNQFATQKYNGQYFKKTCTFINNGGWDGYNTGEDVIGLNWNGVGDLSGSKTYSDPGVFITDMFTKIKSYIPTDKSDIGLGFLPTYIITFLLFLILFRFLSH